MMYLGIDPGLTGAIALYDQSFNRILELADIPVRERVYGTGKEVNWSKFKDLLIDIIPIEGDIVVVLENVGAMPKQGVTSSFNFGETVGGIRATIETMGLNYILLHPATWKRRLALVGTDKDATLNMVRNVYPEVSHLLNLKKHHNRADAIAIAVAGSL